MGSVFNLPLHRQVCLSTVAENEEIVFLSDATDKDKALHEAAYSRIDHCKPQPGIEPSVQDIAVYPMLSEKSFIQQLREFHEVLVKATANIVDRWWDDGVSDFPSRMPLEPQAETILKWIDKQSKNGSMPPIADCLGNWRPDFLLTHNEGSGSGRGAGFQICEINCRTPFNACIHSAYKHDITNELFGPDSSIKPAGDSKAMVDGLLNYYSLDLPIHLVRGRDSLDRQEFIQLVELRTGLSPKLVDMTDLELRQDSSSSTGLALYCNHEKTGDRNEPERIHQLALVLFPEEYSQISPDILCHLAGISVNDLRVNLLVNDQRFLGIILQELDNLSKKHNVLTPDEVKILQEGIVDTILPGSPELQQLLERNAESGGNFKNSFILKAARASRGDGHLMGDELSEDEWDAKLLEMQDSNISPNTTSYVLQPYVQQPKFDILAGKTRVLKNSLVVGTYYSVNGRFAGLGPWRTGTGKICNVYGGGCVLVSSVTTVDT